MARLSSIARAGCTPVRTGGRNGWSVAHGRRLRIHVGAHHFDSNERLVVFHPGIVSRRDRVGLARYTGLLGAILVADRNQTCYSVSESSVMSPSVMCNVLC